MRASLCVVLVLSAGCTLPRSTLGSPSLDGSERDAGGGTIDAGPDAERDAYVDRDDSGRDANVDACVALSAIDGCGGGDEDCDGSLDEDCACAPGTTRPCGACGDGIETCLGTGWGICTGATPPPTYYRDADSDGAGDATMPMTSCAPVLGYVLDASDCDDACTTCFPRGTEVCDGLDNDCDGTPDDGLPTARWYRDADGDGFGDPATGVTPCMPPGAGWVSDNRDCDDACARCQPGYPFELCGDGADNDCDGAADTSCDCDIFTAGAGTYVYCPDTQNWDGARMRCRSIGGDLVSLETRVENTAVWTVLDGYDTYVWTGGNDITTEGAWMWTSGVPFGACTGMTAPCNWEPGQPNGGNSDDCIVLRWDWGGRWGDINCGTPYPFACEL